MAEVEAEELAVLAVQVTAEQAWASRSWKAKVTAAVEVHVDASASQHSHCCHHLARCC